MPRVTVLGRALDRSLDKLGLDYVDMFLLHWPLPSRFSQTVASYRVLEQNLAAGRIRAIGVCNHDAANLEALMAETSLVPAVNQVELHPFFPQKELAQAHARLGIVTQAWSPLGGVNVYDAAPGKARKAIEARRTCLVTPLHLYLRDSQKAPTFQLPRRCTAVLCRFSSGPSPFT